MRGAPSRWVLPPCTAWGGQYVTPPLLLPRLLQVPLGEQYVTDPHTGRHYEIKWAQDEAGNLQVGGAGWVRRALWAGWEDGWGHGEGPGGAVALQSISCRPGAAC